MSRILVIEDRYFEIENSFKMMNARYYADALEISIKNTYQEIGDLENLNEYDLIVLDIELGNKSKKDGFGLLEEIKDFDGSLFLKILIISGSDFVRNKLNLSGYENIPSLLKPLDYKTLYSEIRNFIPPHQIISTLYL